jgi:galactokinase/mevalonate kinase-like predicted kinase
MKKYGSILLTFVMIASLLSGCGDKSTSTSAVINNPDTINSSLSADHAEHIHASGALDDYWISKDCFDIMGYMQDNGYAGSIEQAEWNNNTKVKLHVFEKNEWTIKFLNGKMCFYYCINGLTTTYTFILKDKLLKESRNVTLYGTDLTCKYHDLKALDILVENIRVGNYPSDRFEKLGTAELASF